MSSDHSGSYSTPIVDRISMLIVHFEYYRKHSTWVERMLMRLAFVLTMTIVIALPLMAQDQGGRGAQRGDRGGNPPGGQRAGGGAPGGAAPAMTLTIPGFPDGGQVPVKYSQAAEGAAPGEGTSPAMNWTNPPAGTQSFVL